MGRLQDNPILRRQQIPILPLEVMQTLIKLFNPLDNLIRISLNRHGSRLPHNPRHIVKMLVRNIIKLDHKRIDQIMKSLLS